MDELMRKVAEMLTGYGLKVATAESCTGGLIGDTLTGVPGSSTYYEGGVISYSNALKRRFLNVDAETLERHGAVSEQTVREMAVGIRDVAGVDIGVATTGIAGPGGGTPGKPVGLVYIGLANGGGVTVTRHMFDGSRRENKMATCRAALQMLYDHVSHD
ncbi:MAG: CinA family protein [Thermoplasmatota archaeon]